MPLADTVIQARLDQHVTRMKKGLTYLDTVGAVAYHPDFGVFAGTSTGGRGGEFPGRISDAGTVAGTYSSKFAAISTTGHGEEIVNDAVAARIETQYGWIALDGQGHWNIAYTTVAMSYIVVADRRGQAPLIILFFGVKYF